MKNRRSLTPPPGPVSAPDVHAMRRAGARRELSARVSLKLTDGSLLEGWALNVSKGGVRVILEEQVELGSEYLVTLTDSSGELGDYHGRVVWVQEEPDGVVAGIEFVDVSGTHPSVPPPDPVT